MSDGPKKKQVTKSPNDQTQAPTGEFLLYTSDDGQSRVEYRFANVTIWLSQVLTAELFDRGVRRINAHLKNIINEEELNPAATIRKFRIVRLEGKLIQDSVIRKSRTTADDKKSFDAEIVETSTCKDYLQVRQEEFRKGTIRKFRIVRRNGSLKVNRLVNHHNLRVPS